MLAQLDTVFEVCGEDAPLICRWVYERSQSAGWARAASWLIDRPLRILIILTVGLMASALVRRAVRRFGDQALARSERLGRSGQTALGGNGRARQRASTLTSVVSSLATATVWVVVGLLVLGQVGITLGPLLAGAGVVGVVLAFGAQRVVADFLAGLFMLSEDQFGVGDIVDVGEVSGTSVSGTVEKVSLRVTTLRDVHGTVWYVPNSEIRRVGNKSQLWSRAVLDIEVAHDTDIRRAQQLIEQVAEDLWRDESFTGGDIIEQPRVLGVEHLAADGVTIRLVVKTDPADQWAVARELRLRIKEALDEATIAAPVPQRTIWVRSPEGLSPGAAGPDTIGPGPGTTLPASPPD